MQDAQSYGDDRQSDYSFEGQFGDSTATATSGLTFSIVAESQQALFDYFLEIVKSCSPEYVLSEFKRIFFSLDISSTSDATAALGTIVMAGDEAEFRNTLKRSCYILINNWDISRQFGLTQALIKTFQEFVDQKKKGAAPKRLRQWLHRFIDSPDYQELKLFSNRFLEEAADSKEWITPYTSYLLVHQYANFQNSVEQRDAARKLAQRLKDQFKFDLARYTVLSQSGRAGSGTAKNPTVLGDGALRLIKAIVATRGNLSYKNLARLFLEQVEHTNYDHFKRSLSKYLLFAIRDKATTERLNHELLAYLSGLYTEYDSTSLNRDLILRTSNRVIDYFLIDTQKNPSPMFFTLLSQGNSLTLAIVLLKVVLVSRDSLLYLEGRVADLLKYYEQFPREQCGWIINFLEVLRVAFTIYTDNVEYNLVRMGHRLGNGRNLSVPESEAFHIYTQIKSA